MTREETELTIDYLKEMQEEYIEGDGYERHPLPEWYALDNAIQAIAHVPTVQDKQAEHEKYQKAYDDGYADGYDQARFDYEQEPSRGYENEIKNLYKENKTLRIELENVQDALGWIKEDLLDLKEELRERG